MIPNSLVLALSVSYLLLIFIATSATNKPTTYESVASDGEHLWECSSEEQSVIDHPESNVCKRSKLSGMKDDDTPGLPGYLQSIIEHPVVVMLLIDCVVIIAFLFFLAHKLYLERRRKVINKTPKYKYEKSTDPHEKVPVSSDIIILNKLIQQEVKMMEDMEVDCPISSFRELLLKPEIRLALDALNFRFPARIQETVLPLLMMEPSLNLIAQAQSDAEQTAAFVLTMLCRIDENLECPQIICLTPTLKLAERIGKLLEKMGRYMENLKIHYAIEGGNMASTRGRNLTEQIVIGTPGITLDYLQENKCIDPSQIKCLVLDEADVMYHQGLTDISMAIYKTIKEASESVQSILFSTTFDKPVINFAMKISKNAITTMLERKEQALPNIKQFYAKCACGDSKYAAIMTLYSELDIDSSVIFCHTKASVMWLYENMKARGHEVDVLHEDMSVVKRADTIIRFKRGDFEILITTNVFSRGIDVAQVSLVINFDLPIKYDERDAPLVIDGFTQPDCKTYRHRIGRTGRFGNTVIAVNLIDSEDSMNMINVLENHFQIKIAPIDSSKIAKWNPWE